MKVQLHAGSKFVRPIEHSDVACTKVLDDQGRIVVVALQQDSGVYVVTADDPNFETFLKQYGLQVKRAEPVTVHEP